MYSDNACMEYDGPPEPQQSFVYNWLPFLRWTRSSPHQLQEAEERMLEFVAAESEGFYVNLGEVNSSPCRIWTRVFSGPAADPRAAPLVLIHGMGAGSALWALNISALCDATRRRVVTLDLPGFARSSRCKLGPDPDTAETQYVLCLELWRQAMGLDTMVLLGHSFGGYLAASYALQHPRRLERLLLVDPWGVTDKPTDLVERHNISLGARILFKLIKRLNPLWGLRVAGPVGPRLLPRFRPDLVTKFSCLLGESSGQLIPSYLYHCNAHTPSGEAAFHSLSDDYFWAARPMLSRLSGCSEDLRVSFIYGEDSWVTAVTEAELEAAGARGEVEVITIAEARHHVYADQWEEFNEVVARIVESK